MRPVAATGVTRHTKRAMVLGGCYLPAGTTVNVPFYAVPILRLRVLSLGLLCPLQADLAPYKRSFGHLKLQ